ncbi:MAG: YARHG domain-containing protein [Myxococcales bacterium]|nr:YARHG domain-containing protein [Myxococcales bacterium]
MRIALLVLAALLGPTLARAESYQPAPAASVASYHAALMPCRITPGQGGRDSVVCQGDLLENKTLRELALLRNTIYARYGWDAFRKPWLKAHFHAQPWFTPNPRFSYKLLTNADRKNAHFIGLREQSFTESELSRRQDDIDARYGRVWADVPEWEAGGKKVRACARPKGVDDERDHDEDASRDCRYRKAKWYKADPKFSRDTISQDDKIELGLLSRARGQFALDDGAREEKESALDRLLPVAGLRQLSMRDLRILRNTIYARRGRRFKSKILQEHFQGMGWYRLDPAYTDKLLTATDQRNIALLKSVENEFGGPLSDEDYLAEPVLDMA